MTEQEYMQLLLVIHRYLYADPLIISFHNGLKVRCVSFTGIMEEDYEPDEEEYVGEYTIGVGDVEILTPGSDDSVEIYEGNILINIYCIPETIALEDGTALWQRSEESI